MSRAQRRARGSRVGVRDLAHGGWSTGSQPDVSCGDELDPLMRQEPAQRLAIGLGPDRYSVGLRSADDRRSESTAMRSSAFLLDESHRDQPAGAAVDLLEPGPDQVVVGVGHGGDHPDAAVVEEPAEGLAQPAALVRAGLAGGHGDHGAAVVRLRPGDTAQLGVGMVGPEPAQPGVHGQVERRGCRRSPAARRTVRAEPRWPPGRAASVPRATGRRGRRRSAGAGPRRRRPAAASGRPAPTAGSVGGDRPAGSSGRRREPQLATSFWTRCSRWPSRSGPASAARSPTVA